MPTFDGRGLVPPGPAGAPVAPMPVELSSDESRGEEEEEEDSEVTPEGMGETSPLSMADILHTLPDDDEADARQEKGEPPMVPMRGRTALVSQGATPALTPPGAASGPSAAPASAPGACAHVLQASRLSGFKLTKWRVDYATVDQPTPVTKKRKEGVVVPPGTNPPAPSASPSVEKGCVGAHVSPARSSSRGMGENPREESAPVASLDPEAPASGSAVEASEAQELPASQAMVTIPSPPPPAAPLIPSPSASPDYWSTPFWR
nr:nascent polypeptide-associated complex subunit alpha, muscle-specific form-like [Aegilops tauschii subsp. strangulata]